MEMCYDGALVMPSNYAVMDEEEMMYVEGGGVGKHFWNSTKCVGIILDVLLISFSTGISLRSMASIKKMISANRKKMVKRIEDKLYKYIGTAAKSLAVGAMDIAFTITGMSIGGIFAEALDRADGKNDNYIFA